jgi:hypothetical protein
MLRIGKIVKKNISVIYSGSAMETNIKKTHNDMQHTCIYIIDKV